MPAGFPVTEHGGGAMGIKGCSCDDCKARRREHRAELADARQRPPARRVAVWETYNGTPTLVELMAFRS